ncbi:coiled-coil domain-containing protein 13 [Cimex lectularius]|uniref:Coiled-coil domain-containing protein 13 n=1 Tax=Cimex lectularius TaxID=79782 RepID=A0A8I6TFS5_CIMLE|nr:coiled-coil domain-containing protein 13 [Cimex lectularius]
MVGTSVVEDESERNFSSARYKNKETRNVMNHDFKPMFPDSLNQKLKAEVDGLQCENLRLRKCLQEAEKKLCDSRGTVDIPSPLRGLGRSSDLAASKIVELSKKVRELNAKLGTAQSKAQSAEAQLAVYIASKASVIEEPTQDEPTLLEQKDNQLKELQEKLTTANNKLCDARNQVQQLKHELKLSQKVLASEVGDEATLQNALSGTGNWRGRAQQIIALQQKVSELTNKLSTTDIPHLEKSAISVATMERHADKEKMNALTREVEALKMELSDTRNKMDASRARVKVLTNELGGCKAQIHNLTTKGLQDEQMISKLTEQIGGMMERSKEREESLLKSLKDRINDMSIELNQEKAKVEQLRAVIAEQEDKIERLESKNQDHKMDTQSPVQIMEFNDCRPMSTASSFDRHSSGSGCILQTSEAERLRLMELVSVLNKRLDNERKTLEKAMDDLRRERHKGAKMETKLAKLEMEKIGCSRGNSCSSVYQKSVPKTAQSSYSTAVNAELEMARDRCELLQEKVLALETRLETLKQEREEDSRIYMNILEETRNTVKEHLRSSAKSSSIPSTVIVP